MGSGSARDSARERMWRTVSGGTVTSTESLHKKGWLCGGCPLRRSDEGRRAVILLLVAWWGLVLALMPWTQYARAENPKHKGSREPW